MNKYGCNCCWCSENSKKDWGCEKEKDFSKCYCYCPQEKESHKCGCHQEKEYNKCECSNKNFDKYENKNFNYGFYDKSYKDNSCGCGNSNYGYNQNNFGW